MKVLLADDSATARFVARRALERLGHECVVAEDGFQAWDRFRHEEGIEVVLSDWVMPGMSGEELCRLIRNDPEAPYAYFVMLTSLEGKEHVLRGMEAGVDDYLTKPLVENDLAMRLIAAARVTSLHRRLARQQRAIEREVEVAADVQRGLLPGRPPVVDGLDLVGRCVPAASVGGDYYDHVVDASGRLVVVVADVAGHSISSALLMALARSVLRREILDGHPPDRVLGAANESLYADLVTAGLFITAFCARFDPRTGDLEFANAGHNLPLLHRPGSDLVELDADGVSLGILPDVEFEAGQAHLSPGDLLLLSTDGVVEGSNRQGEPFGDDRLAEIVRTRQGSSAGTLVDGIYEAVRRHTGEAPAQDDITVVALQILGKDVTDAP